MKTHDLKTEYENTLKDQVIQRVEQGYEEISFDKPQISGRFQQCNALLLVNPYDGTTLFKHVGPRSIEVFAGGDRGENFQENYLLFMTHAETHGQKVIVTPVYGDLSHKREYLIKKVQQTGNEKNIQIDVVDPILVPSTNRWVWDMAYYPQKCHVITKHYDGSDTPIYTQHIIPGLKPELFADPSDIAKILETVSNNRRLKNQITKAVSFTQPKDLQKALADACQSMSQEDIHIVLQNPISDFQGNARDTCVSEFKRQVQGRSNMLPEETLECLEILSCFDNQDEKCLSGYISAVLECLQISPTRELQDIAGNKLAAMKKNITNTDALAYLEKREKYAREEANYCSSNYRRHSKYDRF